MPLNFPDLDDRSFQQLVDEAKKRIPYYLPQWTDHNVSDPGVTLIELFAWLTETTLYRLNRVPERHYVKFMEMLGIQLHPPSPARVPVTFWLTTPLSAPKSSNLRVAAHTEVSSTQTETEPAIVFTTEHEVKIIPPELSKVVTAKGKAFLAKERDGILMIDAGDKGNEVFGDEIKPESAFYVGFDNDISHQVLRFEMEWEYAAGGDIDPEENPIIWEAAIDGANWAKCNMLMDTTAALNDSGRIELHTPNMALFRNSDKKIDEKYWLRGIIPEDANSEKKNLYSSSPKLKRMIVESWGGSAIASHSRIARDELLGNSDGSPGQTFYLQNTPIINQENDPDDHLLEVYDGNNPPEFWKRVDKFDLSDKNKTCFTLDFVSGEIRFPPIVQDQKGKVLQFGQIPPRGARLIYKRYRFGGGIAGNVDKGVLNTLATTISYVSKISNLTQATDGQDVESLEHAMLRVSHLFNHNDRAVTAVDYERLIKGLRESDVARVKCLESEATTRNGEVKIFVIPAVKQPERFITHKELEVAHDDLQIFRSHLEERRMLTTIVDVNQAAYHPVLVEIEIEPRLQGEQNLYNISSDIEHRLYRFINPIIGGHEGKGWPFGETLYISDIYACLQGIQAIVKRIELFEADTDGNKYDDEPKQEISIMRNAVIVSGKHLVLAR